MMRGKAQPRWTQGRQAWLQKLVDGGGRATAEGMAEPRAAYSCLQLCWCKAEPGTVRGFEITPAGRAVLADWLGDSIGAAPTRSTLAAAPFQVRIGFAMRGATAEELAWWLIDTGRAREVMEALGRLAKRNTEPVPKPEAPEQAAPASPAPAARPAPAVVPGPVAAAPAWSASRPGAAPVAAMGATMMPPGWSACICCSGRGRTGHGFACAGCSGSGKIRREVVT